MNIVRWNILSSFQSILPYFQTDLNIRNNNTPEKLQGNKKWWWPSVRRRRKTKVKMIGPDSASQHICCLVSMTKLWFKKNPGLTLSSQKQELLSLPFPFCDSSFCCFVFWFVRFVFWEMFFPICSYTGSMLLSLLQYLEDYLLLSMISLLHRL